MFNHERRTYGITHTLTMIGECTTYSATNWTVQIACTCTKVVHERIKTTSATHTFFSKRVVIQLSVADPFFMPETGRIQRVRSFKTTSKGLINHGDSFKQSTNRYVKSFYLSYYLAS